MQSEAQGQAQAEEQEKAKPAWDFQIYQWLDETKTTNVEAAENRAVKEHRMDFDEFACLFKSPLMDRVAF